MTAEERFWAKVDKSGECWLWTSAISPGGYGAFWLDKAHRATRAHRLSYEWAHGPIPRGMFICHHCDVRACVNPDHLFAGTAMDNMRDRGEKGRTARVLGEKHHHAIVSDATATAVVLAMRRGIKARRLAAITGLPLPLVYKLGNGRRWSPIHGYAAEVALAETRLAVLAQKNAVKEKP